jgi:hypothetical protein
VNTQEGIMKHVTEFYKTLFGSGRVGGVSLLENFWVDRHFLLEEEKEMLTKPFQEAEVKRVIFDMKADSAPGPNGFGVHFFKTFWHIIKGDYMALVQDFYRGALDMRRLNYGVVTLVPKLKEATNIKQYRPICLLNVDFKGITKILNSRLSLMAKEVIGPNQTGFVKEKYFGRSVDSS